MFIIHINFFIFWSQKLVNWLHVLSVFEKLQSVYLKILLGCYSKVSLVLCQNFMENLKESVELGNTIPTLKQSYVSFIYAGSTNSLTRDWSSLNSRFWLNSNEFLKNCSPQINKNSF